MRQCRVCGRTHGTPAPPKSLPDILGSWSPMVALRREGRALVVIATKDLGKGDLIDTSPTLWFDRPTEVRKMGVLNIEIGGPNPKGVFLAPAVYQCKTVEGTYVISELPPKWEGAVIPLGYGALYETGVGGTVNIHGSMVFEKDHLFIEWRATKDIRAGQQLRHGMGVHPRE